VTKCLLIYELSNAAPYNLIAALYHRPGIW